MEVLIVRDTISEEKLQEFAKAWFGTMVKGVADIKRGILALGGGWHMDANNVLIADGSRQEDLWGFNVYPVERGGSAIEFISLVNIRPAQGNRGMEIQDETVRNKITELVRRCMPYLAV